MTPAEKVGLVKGKKMRITALSDTESDKGSWAVSVGQLVEINHDDNTERPFVNVFHANGDSLVEDEVIHLKAVTLENAFKEVEIKDVNYNVSICNGSTTIVLQKRLSVEEVHAFLKAVGV